MVVGESINTTDVAIIGAGPGGYTAAIRAAELGKKVILIDMESVGGVCLHHGCIPTKALIHAADAYREFENAERFGISYEGLSIDYSKTNAWKNEVVNKLDQGIRTLLKKHKIKLVQAKAFFESSNKLGLRPVGDEHLDVNAIEFKKCIVAIGSQERNIQGVEVDGEKIITAHHMLEMDELPESMLVIGGGYIGVEASQMLAKLGVKVTIVEALPTILNLLDDEFNKLVSQRLEELGSKIYTNSKVKGAKVEGGKVKVTIETGDGEKVEEAEKVMVAVGRVPDTSSLNIKNTKVELDEKGFIKVDKAMRTSDPRIMAIGDVVGGVMLAHKAAYEGKVAAEVIAGEKSEFDNEVPYAIFSDPEIAGVGMTEKECKEKKVKYEAKYFKYSNLGKGHIFDDTDGFFKILFDEYKNILGVHIAGLRASDMIGEAVVAIEMGATVEDIALMIHPHPTLVEGYTELADLSMGLPINS